MTDAERAAALADDVVRNERKWSRNGYRITENEVDLIVRGLRRLAEQHDSSPAPISTANCAHCGRIVDTREEKDGGDKFGCELADGRWSCSIECYDALTGEAPAEASPAGDLREAMTNAIIHASQEGHDAVGMADAALSAISAAGYVILSREPTPSMLYRGGGMVPGDRRDIVSARIIWSVMVDTAIAAKEPAP